MSLQERWWNSDEPHVDMFGVLKSLQEATDTRDKRWARAVSIYLNRGVNGWTPGLIPSEDQTWRTYVASVLGITKTGEKVLYLNPSANCIAALAARIASQKIRPQFMTSTTGTEAWKVRRRARGLQRAVDGEWYRERVYRKSRTVFFDGGTVGMGVMKGFVRGGKPRFERTWPGNLIVDEGACCTCDPRTLYQVAYPPVDVLLAEYGSDLTDDEEQAVEDQAGKFGSVVESGYAQVSDLVKVVEGWHLPSTDGGDDGMHVVAVDGVTLLTEDWKWDRFPFAWLPWREPILGFWPQGLIESAEPKQQQENKLFKRIQDAMHLYSVAKTYAQKNTINPDHLRNVTGDLVEFSGNVPPTATMPASVSSEAFAFVWQLDAKVYEEEGVSQLSASSKKPAGIESGAALRTLQDNETGRHALLSQIWEDYFCDLADLTVRLCQSIPGYKARARDEKGGWEDVDWSEIDLDRDCYELQVFPTSYLPSTPAGRLATVQDMLQAQFIDQKQALQLLNMPDLDQFASLATASLEDIDRQIAFMIDKDEEQTPEPYMDLELGLARVTSALLRARQDGVPDKQLRHLLNWIEQAQALMNPPAPPVPPPGGDAGMPPGPLGGPGPMPGPGGLELPPVPPPGTLGPVEGGPQEPMMPPPGME